MGKNGGVGILILMQHRLERRIFLLLCLICILLLDGVVSLVNAPSLQTAGKKELITLKKGNLAREVSDLQLQKMQSYALLQCYY